MSLGLKSLISMGSVSSRCWSRKLPTTMTPLLPEEALGGATLRSEGTVGDSFRTLLEAFFAAAGGAGAPVPPLHAATSADRRHDHPRADLVNVVPRCRRCLLRAGNRRVEVRERMQQWHDRLIDRIVKLQ
jgi:hypothetical protein